MKNNRDAEISFSGPENSHKASQIAGLYILPRGSEGTGKSGATS
jgi:hypothetical protein